MTEEPPTDCDKCGLPGATIFFEGARFHPNCMPPPDADYETINEEEHRKFNEETPR